MASMEEKTNENENMFQSNSEIKNENISENTEKNQPDQKNHETLDGSEKRKQNRKRKNASISQNTKKKQPDQMNNEPLDKSKKSQQKQKKKKKNDDIPENTNTQPDQKNKGKLDGCEKSQQEDKKQNEENTKKNQTDQENKEKLDGSENKPQKQKKMNEIIPKNTEKNQLNKENKEKLDGSQNSSQKQKKMNENIPEKEKLDGSEKSQQKEIKKHGIRRGGKSERDTEKNSLSERDQKKEKQKDKPGGIIFMCSSKTKPDCFRYQVMGVSMGKKDLVLSIKPGMKLFLYDFDLKLLYGIYKASSSGGTKLEPAAFGGAFPAQVRFEVHKDCFPLPESVFKKAIKENYNQQNKFKTELTVQQVRKLAVLFQPANVRSSAHIHIPPRERPRNREPYKEAVDSRTHSRGERHGRDSYTKNDSRRNHVQSFQDNHHIGHREVASTRREEIPRESFLTEQEYRTYGLRGKRQSFTPPRHAPLDSYQRDLEHELHLRHPPRLYRDVTSAHNSSQHDPALLDGRDSGAYGLVDQWQLQSPVQHPALLLDGREYRNYTLAPLESQLQATLVSPAALDAYSNDPYYANQVGALSTGPYGLSLRSEDIRSRSHRNIEGRRDIFLSESDQSRRETEQMDRSYSTYVSNSLPDYNQRHQYSSRAESTFAPVSSRYTFAGPSSSRR